MRSLLGDSRSSQRLGEIEVRPGTPDPAIPKVEDVRYGRIDPSAAAFSTSHLPTQHEHAREIRQAYGYRDLSDPDAASGLRELGCR